MYTSKLIKKTIKNIDLSLSHLVLKFWPLTWPLVCTPHNIFFLDVSVSVRPIITVNIN